MPLRTKTSYHPYLLIAFHLQCLPDHITAHIPKSTRYDWNRKDATTQFGYDWYLENQNLFDTLKNVSANKHLLKVNRALIRVIAIKRFCLAHAKRIKDNVNHINDVIVNNIRKIKPVIGLATTLKYIQHPYSWYLRIRRKQRRAASLSSLCRIKHPAQLLQ